MSFLFRYLRFHDIIGGIHVPVDDGVDKLNRKYTLLVFLFLALPIFTKQYIGDPIECFAPVYFAEHQSRYINSYCWTQSTYYMVPVGDPEDDGDQQEPPDRIMPDEVDYFIGFETVTHIGNERLRRVRVSYYQWAPLILFMQGLCFYIPFLIWNSCANNAGVKLRRLLKKASDIASLPPGCQQREALLAEFVDQFHTLVMGDTGWCADLHWTGAGASSGHHNNNNSLAGSSVGSNASNQFNSGGGQATLARAGGGQQAGRSGHDHDHHEPTGGGRSRGANQNSSGGGAGAGVTGSGPGQGGAGSHAGSSAVGPQPGCCLVSIPIIGHLLACCLKPCASIGLVGPSKYLCLLYLAVKFAYVFNVGLQFFLLGQFLGRGYLKHGLELINRLLLTGDWWASPRFPLSTLCQVRADMSGGLRSYTCQCVLPINVFNEKIFSVVWFYMAFLMPLNVLSLLFWIYRTLETNRLSYIRLCLWRTRLVELNQIHRTVRRLSQSYLGWDGVFLLRLIEHNHGSIMATLIMSRLWEFYANQMKLQEDANQLALASNAQYTLSQTTTAISNQHQLLAAAAAAHQQHQQQQHHGHNQSHSHSHSQQQQHHHHPPQQQQQQQSHHHNHAHHSAVQQQQPQPAHGPPHHAHTGHHHHQTAHGHAHPPSLLPAQLAALSSAAAAANQFGPAGNTSGHFAQGPAQPGPLGGAPATTHSAFHSQAPGGTPSAAVNHHGQASSAAAAAAAAAIAAGNASSLLAQLQQQQQQHSSGQSGNVSAAVAALAAAAAAANNCVTSQQTSGATSNQGSNTTLSLVSGGKQLTGQQQPATLAAKLAASSTQTASNNKHHPPIHLHSLMQPSQAGSALAEPPSNHQQVQQQQQQVGAATNQTNHLSQTSNSVAQQTIGGSGSQSTTTSFITASQQQQPTGPPLPPPPPAHVVAAVAAAAAAGVAAASGGSNQPTAMPKRVAGQPIAATTAATSATNAASASASSQSPKLVSFEHKGHPTAANSGQATTSGANSNSMRI